MNAVLKEETPELIETRTGIPPAMDQVVRRCLEKEAERRFQSAGDLAFALEGTASTVLGVFRHAVFSPTGHVLFEHTGEVQGIWAFPFSLEGTERTGEPFRVAEAGSMPRISNFTGSGRHLSFYDVTADGQRFLMLQKAADAVVRSARPNVLLVENWFENNRTR